MTKKFDTMRRFPDPDIDLIARSSHIVVGLVHRDDIMVQALAAIQH